MSIVPPIKTTRNDGVIVDSIGQQFTVDQLAGKINKMEEALELLLKQTETLEETLKSKDLEVLGWNDEGGTVPLDTFFEENDLGAVEAAKRVLRSDV